MKQYQVDKIDILCSRFPLYSEDLGIDIKDPGGRFRWFLASILFGARISEKTAIKTYRTFEKYNVLDPDKILDAGWDVLVEILDEGGYVRYDFSTATKLLNVMKQLKEEYGVIDEIYARSENTDDLIARLKKFKGIGPVTARIFLRELREVWKIDLPISPVARETARRLGLDIEEIKGEELARIESALVKLGLRYCKKKKCDICLLKDLCIQKLSVRS